MIVSKYKTKTYYTYNTYAGLVAQHSMHLCREVASVLLNGGVHQLFRYL
jgi:hypothetical protein